MLVGSIMSAEPVVVEGDHTVLHVARLMRDRHVGAVVVVDDRSRPVGILTDRDITVRAFASAEDDPGGVPVDQVMTRPPVTVGEDTLVFDLLRTMAERHVRRVPVVDGDGALVGMVSVDDIVLLVTTELSNLAEILGHSSKGVMGRTEEE